MAQINDNYLKLKAGYLFPEIGRRVSRFCEANPGAEVIRLGIGDVTEPLAPAIADGSIVPILADYRLVPPSTPIHAVFQHRRHIAPKVRAFIDFLVDSGSDGLENRTGRH